MSRKILHCADLHGNLDWFRWLRQVAPGFDLVCIAGDLLDLQADDLASRQIQQISALLGDFPVPLALCSGNHDVVSADGGTPEAGWMQALRGPRLWVDGDRWQLLGHHFRCLGWNCPVPESRPEEIWISHAPPECCAAGINLRGEDHGDFEFGTECCLHRGPRLALCGHVHEPQAWHDRLGTSLIFNPGFLPAAPFPSHVVLDLERGVAELRRPRRAPQAISWRGQPCPLPAGRTNAQLWELLEQVIVSQRIEGNFLTTQELNLVRQRLAARVRTTQPKENP